jgi:endonuclease G
MTNRHVAKLFTDGLGSRRLVYRAGDAAVNFKRQRGDAEDDHTAFVEVRSVVMIHPYWDMALLRVDGLPGVTPLKLSVDPPEALLGREVAAVGYPARDDRNDLDVQDRIFQRIYGVKRFQPGKVRPRASIKSFETVVSALTHDSSTLGGNSGSALVDVKSGQVVGLHFAGVYLKDNYAVPTYELARDPRVVAAGLNFAGTVAPTGDFDAAWERADGDERVVVRPGAPAAPPPAVAPAVQAEAVTWTVPLQVTVSLGPPTLARAPAAAPAAPGAAAAEVEALRVPFIAPDLDSREGYRPDFLGVTGGVPLPELTAAGEKAVARLEDGSFELKYYHFSVVVHKKRRLALFTAANVDWRPGSRQVNGRKPTRRELTELGEHDFERWVTDPRIPDAHQLPDVFYTKGGGAFDKGHLVRRDDVAWGRSFADMQKGNGDTYHTPNCSPQVAAFNRAGRGEDDNWGDLENLVQKQTRAETVCVFSGPILADNDPIFRGRDLRGEAAVQVPRKFWKVIVAKGEGGPEAYGFVLEQDLSGVPLEMVVPAAWQRHMAKIADIESSLNGLAKLTWLKKCDQFESATGRGVAEAVRR